MLNGQHFEASEYEQELVDFHLHNGFPVTIRQESVYDLRRKDDEFDCILLLEVLEHLGDYHAALKEIFRVAGDVVIISVPNEPLWRALNLLRGKYLMDLGNTPGHVNHWSAGEFTRLVAGYGTVVRVLNPVPWTIIEARAT